MTETILQLRADEVWSALEVIDPVAVLAEELIGGTIGRERHDRRLGRLTPWTGPSLPDTHADQVVLEHPGASVTCVAPAATLRMSQSAALAALAARELLVSGGVTVAMLGASELTQPQLAVIARHVPDISHVAMCLATVGDSKRLMPRLIDQLELSGIGLSVVTSLADTVFGANLVIAASDGAMAQDLDRLRLSRLARGTVLINATGRDLPIDLVDRVDQVYVDDLGLLEANCDRYVVAAHLAGSGSTVEVGGGRDPRIAADIGQLLTGRHRGRRQVDDVVLVELLGVNELNTELMYRIYQAARRHGLGVTRTGMETHV